MPPAGWLACMHLVTRQPRGRQSRAPARPSLWLCAARGEHAARPPILSGSGRLRGRRRCARRCTTCQGRANAWSVGGWAQDAVGGRRWARREGSVRWMSRARAAEEGAEMGSSVGHAPREPPGRAGGPSRAPWRRRRYSRRAGGRAKTALGPPTGRGRPESGEAEGGALGAETRAAAAGWRRRARGSHPGCLGTALRDANGRGSARRSPYALLRLREGASERAWDRGKASSAGGLRGAWGWRALENGRVEPGRQAGGRVARSPTRRES